MSQLAIKFGGVLSALTGIAHCFYYRGFRWEKEFNNVTTLNAKVFYTIHIFLIPLFFLYAYISWMHTYELSGGSALGITLTLFYAFFWLLRTIWQIIYFRPFNSNVKNGVKFLHYFLICYFFVLCVAYSTPIYNSFIG
jgi:hypothetical protein